MAQDLGAQEGSKMGVKYPIKSATTKKGLFWGRGKIVTFLHTLSFLALFFIRLFAFYVCNLVCNSKYTNTGLFLCTLHKVCSGCMGIQWMCRT